MSLLRADFFRRISPKFSIDAQLSIPAETFGITILFGPSGSGKTSLLRSLAGLDPPDRGSITLGSDVLFDRDRHIHLPPRKRPIGFFFQQYALFPHLNTRANIAFGIGRLPQPERDRRTDQLLDMLDLRHVANSYPSQLSGGEQQRVALARTLAPRPRLLLLDEPLSALDQPTRQRVRRHLRSWLEPFGLPTILVTHDPNEAISLGDSMVVIDAGKTSQTGTVLDLFRRPATPSLASIVGVETIEPAQVVSVGEGSLGVAVGGRILQAALREAATDFRIGQQVVLCIRGEEVMLETQPHRLGSARNQLAGRVRDIEQEGAVYRVTIDVGFPLVSLITGSALEEMALSPGREVIALIKAHGIHVLPRGQ